MKLGLFLSSLGGDPGEYAETVREAERLGFDSVWVPDHVLRVFGPVLDPLTALAFLAGKTRHIRLGTAVLVLPYRHPVPLANTASTLDVLSDGRFLFGVGVGWNAGEFEALGMNVRERGGRTDEMLESLKRLWTGEPAAFSGAFYDFREAEIGTPPRTPGGPPVLIGGKSEAALRRTALYGRGWMGFRDDPDAISAVRNGLDRHCEGAGRDPTQLEIGTTLDLDAVQDSPEPVIEHLELLEDAGATLCALAPPSLESLRWVSEEVAPRLKGQAP